MCLWRELAIALFILQCQAARLVGCTHLSDPTTAEKCDMRLMEGDQKRTERLPDSTMTLNHLLPMLIKRIDVCTTQDPALQPKTSSVMKYNRLNKLMMKFTKRSALAELKRHEGLWESCRSLVPRTDPSRPVKLKYFGPYVNVDEDKIAEQQVKDLCGLQGSLFVLGRTHSTAERCSAPLQFQGPEVVWRDRKSLDSTGTCEADGRLNPCGKGTMVKRSAEENDLASVPWQALWLLESPEDKCGVQVQEAVVRLGTAQRLRHIPHQPVGRCPVRFRPHADPHRWLPRNLVAAECVCEGSPCGRLGTHVCVTVYSVRTVFSLQTGRRKVLLAVGCLCALQTPRISKVTDAQAVA